MQNQLNECCRTAVVDRSRQSKDDWLDLLQMEKITSAFDADTFNLMVTHAMCSAVTDYMKTSSDDFTTGMRRATSARDVIARMLSAVPETPSSRELSM